MRDHNKEGGEDSQVKSERQAQRLYLVWYLEGWYWRSPISTKTFLRF